MATLALGWVVWLAFRAAQALVKEAPVVDAGAVVTGRRRKELEREKQALLKALKELDFDHQMGKVSDKDFADISATYRARAIRVMRQLDDAGRDYEAMIAKEVARSAPRRRPCDSRPAPHCGDGQVRKVRHEERQPTPSSARSAAASSSGRPREARRRRTGDAVVGDRAGAADDDRPVEDVGHPAARSAGAARDDHGAPHPRRAVQSHGRRHGRARRQRRQVADAEDRRPGARHLRRPGGAGAVHGQGDRRRRGADVAADRAAGRTWARA